MQVTCQRCGTEYDFDETLAAAAGTRVRCTTCGNLFLVRANQAAAHWVIQRADGTTLQIEQLAMVSHLIRTGQLSRTDRISREGEPAKSLGEIAELVSIFDQVEGGKKTTLPQMAAAPAGPPLAPPKPGSAPVDPAKSPAALATHLRDARIEERRGLESARGNTASLGARFPQGARPVESPQGARGQKDFERRSTDAEDDDRLAQRASPREQGTTQSRPRPLQGTVTYGQYPHAATARASEPQVASDPQVSSTQLSGTQISGTQASAGKTSAGKASVGPASAGQGSVKDSPNLSSAAQGPRAVPRKGPRQDTALQGTRVLVPSPQSIAPAGPRIESKTDRRSQPLEPLPRPSVPEPTQERVSREHPPSPPSARKPTLQHAPLPESERKPRPRSSTIPDIPPVRTDYPSTSKATWMYGPDTDESSLTPDPTAALEARRRHDQTRTYAHPEPLPSSESSDTWRGLAEGNPTGTASRKYTRPMAFAVPAQPSVVVGASGESAVGKPAETVQTGQPLEDTVLAEERSYEGTQTVRERYFEPQTDSQAPAKSSMYDDSGLDEEEETRLLGRRRMSTTWLVVFVFAVLLIVLYWVYGSRLGSFFSAQKPQDTRALQAQAELLLNKDQLTSYAEAVRLFEKVGGDEQNPLVLVKLAQTHARWAQALLFRLEDQLMKDGASSGAVEQKQALTWRNQAQVHIRHARDFIERATRANAQGYAYELVLADSLRLSHEATQSRAQLTKAKQLNGSYDAEGWRIMSLLEADHSPKRLCVYEKELSAAVTSSKAIAPRLLWARCLWQRGDIQGGLAQLNDVLTQTPQHSEAAAVRDAWQNVLRVADAMPEALPQAAPVAPPSKPEVIEGQESAKSTSSAKEAKAAKSTEQSDDVHTPATASAESGYAVFIQKGFESVREKEPVRATRYFKRALELRPRATEATSGLGYAALTGRKYDEAVKYFKQAIDLGYTDAWIGLARTYQRMGKANDARDSYRQYLSEQPDGSLATAARAALSKLEPQTGGAQDKASNAAADSAAETPPSIDSQPTPQSTPWVPQTPAETPAPVDQLTQDGHEDFS